MIKSFLIITNIPTPYRESFFSALSTNLKKINFSFFVIYFSKKEPNRSWTISPKKSLYKFKILNSIFLNFFGGLNYISLSPFFYWLKNKPTLTVLAGAWHYPSNILIVITSRLTNSKVFFWCESNSYSDINSNFFLKKLRSFYYQLNTFYLVPGVESFNYVRKLNKNSNITILPNAINDIYFLKVKKIVIDFNVNKYNFISISELSDRKGVVELINDFIELIYLGFLPSYSVLNICGSGKYEAYIKALSKKHKFIHFHGFMEEMKLMKLMSKSCAFILNTKLDPNPLVVNEACAMGLVPIVSNCAGNAREIAKISKDFNFTYNFGFLKQSIIKYSKVSECDLEIYARQLMNYSKMFNSENVAKKLINSIIKKTC